MRAAVPPKTEFLSKFEFAVLRANGGLKDQKILVAVSGGRDSMALLHLLRRLQPRAKIGISVAHIHHGPIAGKSEQTKFRDRALAFVRDYCAENGLEFYHSEASIELSAQSEAALRKFRHQELKRLLSLSQADSIALAHHAGDQLETRLIRLIRGTGSGGIVAMRAQSGRVLRPLLACWPEEVQSYTEEFKIPYLTDPSNRDVRYFRNWLRADWLSQLEAFRPGAVKALARSLELLAVDQDLFTQSLSVEAFGEAGIDRKSFGLLLAPEKANKLARYLVHLRAQNYTQNHIKEVLKRLDTPRKNLTFGVASLDWIVTADKIVARPHEKHGSRAKAES